MFRKKIWVENCIDNNSNQLEIFLHWSACVLTKVSLAILLPKFSDSSTIWNWPKYRYARGTCRLCRVPQSTCLPLKIMQHKHTLRSKSYVRCWEQLSAKDATQQIIKIGAIFGRLPARSTLQPDLYVGPLDSTAAIKFYVTTSFRSSQRSLYPGLYLRSLLRRFPVSTGSC